MLSRVADHVYWMARYLERAEHASRVIDVHLNQALDRDQFGSTAWARVATAIGDPCDPSHASAETVLSNAFNPARDTGLRATIRAARENARQVREQISAETFQTINALYLNTLTAKHQPMLAGEPVNFFSDVQDACYRLHGILDNTMAHSQPYHFFQLGRFMERAQSTAKVLHAFLDPTGLAQKGDAGFDAVGLLQCCTAFESYHRTENPTLTPRSTGTYLLLAPDFPRSLRYCAEHISQAANALAQLTKTPRADRLARRIGRFQSALQYTDSIYIADHGLAAFLDDLQSQSEQLHEAVYRTYIVYPLDTLALSA